MTEKPEICVLYNDTCPVCSREVNAYRRASERRGLPISYAGIDSDLRVEVGLSRDDAARRFHVLKDGTLISGIPAFAVLWDDLPSMRWLAWVVRLPVLRTVLGGLYDHILAPVLFAWHKRRDARNAVSPQDSAR